MGTLILLWPGLVAAVSQCFILLTENVDDIETISNSIVTIKKKYLKLIV